MTTLEKAKQLKEAREKATSRWYVFHEKMRHMKNDLIGVDCCEEEPFVVAQMNRNMDNWKNDLTFLHIAANHTSELMDFLLELVEDRKRLRESLSKVWDRDFDMDIVYKKENRVKLQEFRGDCFKASEKSDELSKKWGIK